MRRKIIEILAVALLLAGCGEQPEMRSHLRKCDQPRIVSMAPNVTETLYALGLGSNIVGVTTYCNYPAEAKQKPRVGGTYDPNWEMIYTLKPDLVIGLDSQQDIAAQLQQLDIDFLGVPHERVTEIMQSILLIGDACGAQEKARELFQGLENRVGQASSLPAHAKPKVLICIGHDELLTRMYIAAKNTFYDDLIKLAGGINASEQTLIKYPEISPESLYAMQPDLIIDLVAPNQPSSEQWNHPNVITLTNDYAFIPGPRFGLLLNDLIHAIRPTIESE
jgi:iron complex transport system substrate-binding protein